MEVTQNKSRRYRNVCFTFNNPVDTPEDFIKKVTETHKTNFLVFQLEEAPTTKTPHWQGYVEFDVAYGFDNLRKLFNNNHIGARMGTALQAADYCRLVSHDGKDKGRIAGPWSFGTISDPGKRNDINDFIDDARENGVPTAVENNMGLYVRNHKGLHAALDMTSHKVIRTMKVILLYGPPGVGKSHFVWSKHGTENVGTVDADMKWFDGMRKGQTILLLDEFGGSKSGSSTFMLNKVLDIFPFEAAYKGGFLQPQWTTVYIATNIHPKMWFDWYNTTLYTAFTRRVHIVMEWDFDDRTPRAPDNIHEIQEDKNKFFY